ncbi:MAG: UDP-N-acetylglucosamine 2-epimerase [Candidatus Methylacidiphilales bacterium]
MSVSATSRRTICIVTGTRAEYGLLSRLMRAVRDDADLTLQVIATGMHLSPEFGLTVQHIEADGFTVDARVEMLLSSDSPVGIAKSTGLGVIGFADAIARLKPDLLVVLGDRFEIFAATQAALPARVPIAHIHGGETTEGAMDEAIRHAITKLSHLHFTSAEVHRRRVIQLGEQPDRVFNMGAPGLDNIAHTPLMGRVELEKSLGFELGGMDPEAPLFLVTYHPVTLANESPRRAFGELTTALDSFPRSRIIFTKANADTDGRVINTMLDEYVTAHPERMIAFTSMGQVRYLSAMKYADAVVGNSSSGIIEAPFIKTATVNIGSRQRGRLQADSIINCEDSAEEIRRALLHALDPETRRRTAQTVSPYGDGNATERIVGILKTHPLEDLVIKRFYDLP